VRAKDCSNRSAKGAGAIVQGQLPALGRHVLRIDHERVGRNLAFERQPERVEQKKLPEPPAAVSFQFKSRFGLILPMLVISILNRASRAPTQPATRRFSPMPHG
jgi:hypothetical protein